MPQYGIRYLLAFSLLGVCVLVAIPVVAQKPSVPQALPVNVENTPTVNVANTASVNVANTPSVNVTNTPSVNVANTPSVTLESGASVAVTSPLDGSGNPTPIATLEAVQLYGSYCRLFFNGNSYAQCDFTTIPQGKELVVQEFDADGFVETGNRPVFVALDNTITSGNFIPYTFEVNTNGADYLVAHQETRVYVGMGQSPLCVVQLPASSNGNFICDISGFLVDVPLGDRRIMVQQQKSLSQLLRNLPRR